MRKIIHIDLDAFFAAVEQRDNPSLRGKPVAVGGRRRGVVAAASYEARAYGIHSAMPSVQALKLCPHLVLVPPRGEAYREANARLREIVARYTEVFEFVSIDEAYLDVTDPLTGPPSATLLAGALRKAVFDEIGLTASAGVSFNKFLAKLASDANKPDGLTVVTPKDALGFIAGLPVERFHGVGPKTAARLKAAGFHTGADLQAADPAMLRARFGRTGDWLARLAQADDDRSVRTHRVRKSVGAERTFFRDLRTRDEAVGELQALADRVYERLHRLGRHGHTVTLKLKYADFTIRTRQTPALPTSAADLTAYATRLYDAAPIEQPVRLLGISVSHLLPATASVQLVLPLCESTDR